MKNIVKETPVEMKEKTILTEAIPEEIKQQLALWRALKDKVEAIEQESKPYKDKIKSLEKEISNNLSIEEGAVKSESIALDGCAVVWKNKVITMSVSDWQSLQNYLTRNDCEFVMRKQLNQGGVKELHRMVMEGELPMPKSAEFTTFDKITIRKK
jgi:Zn-dependent M32 family carboxypeptidase